MGRLSTCLLLFATVAAPAFAATGQEPRAPDAAGAIRLAGAFGVITSTWRSHEHNRAVGGVPNSWHLEGRAMDIARRPGVTHRQIDAAFRNAGYNLIESLDEGDHSHLAFGPSKITRLVIPAAVQGASQPPAPPIPSHPNLVADDHGTLRVDDSSSELTSADLPDGAH